MTAALSAEAVPGFSTGVWAGRGSADPKINAADRRSFGLAGLK
jgi:hypothetical protein